MDENEGNEALQESIWRAWAAKKPVRIAGSFVLGLAVGVMFHYALYRMGLPLQPFIYMAF